MRDDSGFVAARPEYDNNVQGTITTSTNALALAVSGNGFFQVNQETTDASGATTLNPQDEYTRDGNFTLDTNGYLVNDTNEALSGYAVDPTTGVADISAMTPIKVDQSPLPPVATSTVALSANLPATPASTTPPTTQVEVYDAQGIQHQVTLTYTQAANNDWTVSVNAPDATTPALGSAQLTFGTDSGNAVDAGTLGAISNDTGTVTSSAYAANSPATVNFTADFGNGPQTISVNMGNYGTTSGITQFAGTAYTLNQVTQNGVAPGTFSGVSIESSGDVVANYNNNETRVIAQIPLTKFANEDALQRQDGQSFTETQASGAAITQAVGSGSVGTLVTSATEGSTVDIATEFTKLIVAQQAYSANAKVVTTADQLLQVTLNMKT